MQENVAQALLKSASRISKNNSTLSPNNTTACRNYADHPQGICGRILKGARADLLKQISLKSTAVAGIQEGKRRDLTNKLQALVSKSEADVTQRALQWHTVRQP